MNLKEEVEKARKQSEGKSLAEREQITERLRDRAEVAIAYLAKETDRVERGLMRGLWSEDEEDSVRAELRRDRAELAELRDWSMAAKWTAIPAVWWECRREDDHGSHVTRTVNVGGDIVCVCCLGRGRVSARIVEPGGPQSLTVIQGPMPAGWVYTS